MHEVFENMSTIANNAETYAAYQRRLDAWRVEAAWKQDREEAHRAKEEEWRAKEEALAALDAGRRQLEEAVRAEEEERRAKEEAVRAQEEAVRAQEDAQARADALARELAELRRRMEGA